MSDLERFLRRGVEGFDPSPEEGLEATRARAERRQRGRRLLAGGLTIAMFGATLTGAVWLGDRSGRPIAGPSPTSSPAPPLEIEVHPAVAPAPHPALGTDTCQGPFDGDVFCFDATSDVVVVGSGKTNGIPWALYAWTGVYRGPEPRVHHGEGSEPQVVELPVLCTAWFFGEQRQPRCDGTNPPYDTWSMALVEMPGKQSGAIQESGDLEFSGSSHTFVIDPFEQAVQGITAVWSWTPPGTSDVTFIGADGRAFQSELFGPVAEIRNGLKWFVAFIPIAAGPLTARAVDGAGEEIWSHDHPPIPTESAQPPRFVPRSSTATVAKGTYGGGRWELRAFQATVMPGGGDAVCLWFEIPAEGDTGRACTALDVSDGGTLSLDTDGDGPLPGFVYGYTSPDTARIVVSGEGNLSEATLYRAPEEMNATFQFFVGFSPRRADVTIHAFDVSGDLLWSDVHPYHPD